MLASRVLITAGTPGHMYLEERQAKCLQREAEGEGAGPREGRGVWGALTEKGKEGCGGAGRARGAGLHPWVAAGAKGSRGGSTNSDPPRGWHSPSERGGGQGTHVMAW